MWPLWLHDSVHQKRQPPRYGRNTKKSRACAWTDRRPLPVLYIYTGQSTPRCIYACEMLCIRGQSCWLLCIENYSTRCMCLRPPENMHCGGMHAHPYTASASGATAHREPQFVPRCSKPACMKVAVSRRQYSPATTCTHEPIRCRNGASPIAAPTEQAAAVLDRRWLL